MKWLHYFSPRKRVTNPAKPNESRAALAAAWSATQADFKAREEAAEGYDYQRYTRVQDPYLAFEDRVTSAAQQAFHNALTVEEVTAYRNMVLMMRCAARDCWRALGREVPGRYTFIDDPADTPPAHDRRHNDA